MNLDNLSTPAAIVTDDRRHPGHGTAPPVHRGSMVPLPWRGFWNSIATALLLRLGGQARTAGAQGLAEPWQRAAARRRQVFVGLSLASTLAATLLFARLQPVYGHAWLGWLQLALFALLSAWVVTGFMTAVMGMWVLLRGDRHALSARSVAGHALAPDARSAVVMPICNEDVATVFAGLRATCESLAATGQARAFDVFVLSDSSEPATIAAERAAWEALRLQLATQAAQTQQPQPEVYYRLRQRRTQRKAGNVADFCRRWGRDYRYMVVLDADSVMSGDCLVNLARLMEAHPRAGIIQTASQGVGHMTLHARAQQFAARVTGRLFTLGMQYWQLGESHYFGHNAIIRIAPFMRHCALAPLAGTGGLSGSILSHDFVEAALMRRAGWQVWLAADLDGSYEQQPPDLLAELQRDRRWCQGNLQNARLVAEPGLHPVHRAMLVTGAMAYLSAPLWLAFITLGTGLWLTDSPLVADWRALPDELLALWAWTLCILFMPRVLGVLAVVLKGEQRQFGGSASLLASALLESVLAILQAPIRMLAHSLFVLVALTGLKLDWKSPPREAAAVPWKDAAARFAPAGLAVAALAAGVALLDARALVWLLPVALPLLAAVPLTVVTSQLALGRSARERRWLLIPEEAWAPRVLRRAWLHASGRVPLAPAAPERSLRMVR